MVAGPSYANQHQGVVHEHMSRVASMHFHPAPRPGNLLLPSSLSSLLLFPSLLLTHYAEPRQSKLKGLFRGKRPQQAVPPVVLVSNPAAVHSFDHDAYADVDSGGIHFNIPLSLALSPFPSLTFSSRLSDSRSTRGRPRYNSTATHLRVLPYPP